jgi:hypothetical protein
MSLSLSKWSEHPIQRASHRNMGDSLFFYTYILVQVLTPLL